MTQEVKPQVLKTASDLSSVLSCPETRNFNIDVDVPTYGQATKIQNASNKWVQLNWGNSTCDELINVLANQGFIQISEYLKTHVIESRKNSIQIKYGLLQIPEVQDLVGELLQFYKTKIDEVTYGCTTSRTPLLSIKDVETSKSVDIFKL